VPVVNALVVTALYPAKGQLALLRVPPGVLRDRLYARVEAVLGVDAAVSGGADRLVGFVAEDGGYGCGGDKAGA